MPFLLLALRLHGAAPTTVIFTSSDAPAVYGAFVHGTQRELIIHTPAIAGDAAIEPLRRLHEENGQATITVLVEGPDAMAQRTPQQLAHITLDVYAIPLDIMSHKRPFHVAGTWLVRDEKDILILPGRVEFRPQGAPDANVGVLIKDAPAEAQKTVALFLAAAKQGQPILTPVQTPAELAPPQSIKDKVQMETPN